jgi:hypothetical protein
MEGRSASLTIPSITDSFNGLYLHCRAYNSSGSVYSHTFQISVTGAPTAPPVDASSSTLPANVSCLAGANATFNTNFTGATSYQWYRGSSSILGAVANSFTLYGTSLTDNSNPNFYCRAINSLGYTNSRTATLTVLSGGVSAAYRPTTGTGITTSTFPAAVDTTTVGIDTTTHDAYFKTATVGVKTSSFTFTGFGTGVHNGTLNIKATGSAEDDGFGALSSVSVKYSYNGGTAITIDSAVAQFDGTIIDLTLLDTFTSATLIGVDLGTLTVTVTLRSERQGVYPDYSYASSTIDIWDIVFLT